MLTIAKFDFFPILVEKIDLFPKLKFTKIAFFPHFQKNRLFSIVSKIELFPYPKIDLSHGTHHDDIDRTLLLIVKERNLDCLGIGLIGMKK